MEEAIKQDRDNGSEVIEGVVLKEGEVICPKCDGEGEVLPPGADEHFGVRTCPKCFGYKKLDWIEMAIGKFLESSSTTSSGGSSGPSLSSCSYEENEERRKFREFLRRRKKNERNNTQFKFRGVQRFLKVSYKLKRNM